MEAAVRKLYSESKWGERWGYNDYPLDEVRVKLLRWSGASESLITLHLLARIDGNIVVDEVKLLALNDDAALIRMAISEFDHLLAAHPTLAQAAAPTPMVLYVDHARQFNRVGGGDDGQATE